MKSQKLTAHSQTNVKATHRRRDYERLVVIKFITMHSNSLETLKVFDSFLFCVHIHIILNLLNLHAL